jgi:hypothetical protein
MLSTVGATYVVEQEQSANGVFQQAVRLTHTYKAAVRFKDVTANELLVESEITRAQGQVPVGFKTVFRSFQATDATSTTLYGGDLSLTAGGVAQTQTLSYLPPLRVPANLAVDQTFTQRYTVRTETLIAGVPGSAEQTGTYAMRFLGKERVSVPAGTFMACKIQLPVNAANPDAGSTIQWLVAEGRYQGLPVRADDGAGQVTVATRLMVNGS